MASWLKRALLGRAITSSKSEHQLLPKYLALPVFSSDTLSSVAYATEEMMIVLSVAGAAAFATMLPIGVAIGVLLVVVVTSYRQTVRAYPQGGGSYIVSKENLGTAAGLLAAAAILTDYILTVAVSMTAGTIAITSAVPDWSRWKVEIALGFTTLVTLANLRGVKEAGKLFAIPTYGFVLIVYVTLATGFFRCLTGCPVAESADINLEAHAALSLFIILRAFSSGASALTGVEAVADGVQAFQRPQSRNAATTLAIMGAMSTSMFLGITVLARLTHVRVSEELHGHRSVLAQIGNAVFDGGFMFFALQVFTAAILFLAANTAFQDFPRLSAILARDRFMPGQFRNRGDRLVFSNGVVVLAAMAGVLIWVFDANLTRLIQLYVVGVFTAFTLSQSGMVVRWLRTRSEGWRRSLTINAIGAATTGVVLVIVSITKFKGGAWIVITAMPIIVAFFWSVHHHYATVAKQLRRGMVAPGEVHPNHVLLLVDDVTPASAEALGYVRSIRPTDVRAVHFGAPATGQAVAARWRELAPTGPDLEVVAPPRGSLVRAVRAYVRDLPREPDGFLTVVIPEVVTGTSLVRHTLRRFGVFRLKVGLLRERNIVVCDVPVHVEDDGDVTGVDARPLIPTRTAVLVLVSAVHDASVRAVNYAASLEAAEVRAVYFALDPQDSGRIVEEWARQRVPIELDVVEAPFRDLALPLLAEVRRETARPDTVVSVVMPELIVKRWYHFPLHNQSSLFIKRLLLFEPRTILSSVPYTLE